jgi:hypothetical protein
LQSLEQPKPTTKQLVKDVKERLDAVEAEIREKAAKLIRDPEEFKAFVESHPYLYPKAGEA